MKVGIVGTGHVGRALGEGLKTKHEVRYASRNPSQAKVPGGTTAGSLKEIPRWAEVVIFAVPYPATRDVIASIGPETLDGKVLVDARNVIGPSGDLAVGFTTSGAEELAKSLPRARVVKAFNSVFAGNMTTGRVGKDPLTLFVAGDDASAKRATLDLGRDLGFDPVDAGPLHSARYLEPLGMLNIRLGYGQNLGSKIGVRLVRAPS